MTQIREARKSYLGTGALGIEVRGVVRIADRTWSSSLLIIDWCRNSWKSSCFAS